MSLRRALERLSHDRAAESATRRIIGLFREHPYEWMDGEDILMRLPDPTVAQAVLDVLSDADVIDFQDAPPRYRYEPDTLLEREVERYFHGAERREQTRQSNLDRFRRRFDDR